MNKAGFLLGLLLTVGSLYLLLNLNFKDQADGNGQGDFTHFVFEREWPGTVCKVSNCTPQYMGNYDGQNFNLHGLWPSGVEGDPCGFIQDCGSSQFSLSNIHSQSVVDYIEAYWVGLYSSQQTFLNHEWNKHGTCLTNSQNDFFTLAIDLHRQFNPVEAFANFGIFPNDDTPYTFEELNEALALSFGGPVRIQCQKVDGKFMLFSFDMYFSKSLEVIPQLCKKNSSCPAGHPVYYPTLGSI